MGTWDVAGMLERMPSSLFSRWLAFDELEPVSVGKHVDVGTGILWGLLSNIYRDSKRRSEPFGVEDFGPVWGGWMERLDLDVGRAGRGDALPQQSAGRGGQGDALPQRARELYGRFKTWALLNG